MIKVKNEVKIHERNDEDIALLENRCIGVESHWNNEEKVVLVVDGERYAVAAKDLLCAIENATNTNN